MGCFSFIHTSDVHLGHQQFNLEERFADFGRAFGDVVNYALNNKVDCVIIGGDFFHKRAINAETLRQALELLQPLKDAGIPVIAIEGNHDKAFYQDKISWLKLLNSLGYLRLLKPAYLDGKITITDWIPDGEGCVTEINEVRVIGLGYLGATTEQRLAEAAELLESSEQFTIMVLHAAVNKFLAQDLGGVKREVLDKFRDKVDYLALGHIHFRDEDGWFFNPGSLENCHIDEAKEGREKGFYHVQIQNGQKTVNHMSGSPRKVVRITVDITGASDPAEVSQKVWTAFREARPETIDKPMVQIVLRGEIDFSALAVDTGLLSKQIKEQGDCLYVEIQNNANLPLNQDEYVTGEFINRNEIEKQVLTRLTSRRYPQYREFNEDLVDLIINIKEAALGGEGQQEIINQIALLAGRLPEQSQENSETEVASAGGEVFENKED